MKIEISWHYVWEIINAKIAKCRPKISFRKSFICDVKYSVYNDLTQVKLYCPKHYFLLVR